MLVVVFGLVLLLCLVKVLSFSFWFLVLGGLGFSRLLDDRLFIVF